MKRPAGKSYHFKVAMKRYIQGKVGLATLIILVMMSAIFPGCARSSTSALPTPKLNATGTMTAAINGDAWTAASITSFSNVNNILAIRAQSADPVIIISFAVLAEGVGTYQISASSPGTNAELSIGTSVWRANAVTGSGAIIFKGMSSMGAIGTFSFTLTPVSGTPATGTKTITGGTFNVRATIKK